MRIGAATDARHAISSEDAKKTFFWRSDAALGYMRNSSEVASNSLALLAKKNLVVTGIRSIMVFNQKNYRNQAKMETMGLTPVFKTLYSLELVFIWSFGE